jgi:LysM repeat protein
VKRGDTLAKIAQASGTTIDVLQAVNCIPNINNIAVGQILFVPNAPIASSSTYKAEGCTDPSTVITSPKVGQVVTGVIKVEGSANINNFALYKLELRPDKGTAYTLYNSFILPVTQGLLGEVDTKIFNPGIYWLKLTTITQTDQAAASCAVPILIAK